MEVSNRPCPSCARNSIAVNALIVSDVICPRCGKRIGVHWLFRSVFFALVSVAAAVTGFVVYVDQGFYAALLFVSVPIGVLGYVKARFSPLVTRRPRDLYRDPGNGIDTKLPND